MASTSLFVMETNTIQHAVGHVSVNALDGLRSIAPVVIILLVVVIGVKFAVWYFNRIKH